MKSILFFAMMLVSSHVFAREVRKDIKVLKGPFTVPATNSVFNILGPDFKGEGDVFVYLTDSTIDIQFPRSGFYSVKAVQDPNSPDYFYTTDKTGPKVRVGFEGDKLAWLFATANSGRVTISDEAEKSHVEATAFAKMSDDELVEFAIRVMGTTNAGNIDYDAKVERTNGLITVKGDVSQMGQDQSEPTVVGQATVTFVDGAAARMIQILANVKDL